MTSDLFLHTLAATCRSVVADTVNGVSVCSTYEDASLVGFMHLHRLCGIRLLMLPMAESLRVSRAAESVFDRYLSQLEDIKSGSRSLLAVRHGHESKQTRPASPAPL
jgi:hypothetical protein